MNPLSKSKNQNMQSEVSRAVTSLSSSDLTFPNDEIFHSQYTNATADDDGGSFLLRFSIPIFGSFVAATFILLNWGWGIVSVILAVVGLAAFHIFLGQAGVSRSIGLKRTIKKSLDFLNVSYTNKEIRELSQSLSKIYVSDNYRSHYISSKKRKVYESDSQNFKDVSITWDSSKLNFKRDLNQNMNNAFMAALTMKNKGQLNSQFSLEDVFPDDPTIKDIMVAINEENDNSEITVENPSFFSTVDEARNSIYDGAPVITSKDRMKRISKALEVNKRLHQEALKLKANYLGG